jgi:sulfate/thiosulfate transport system permease protein
VILWVTGLVVLPVGAVLLRAFAEGPAAFVDAVLNRTALDALWLSTWTAALATAINTIAGTAIAWALVRWDFPGRPVLAALVDLPLAIPTLVAGLVIVALFGPQSLIGGALADAGFPVAFARPGIVLALLLVTLPFVVRAVEPVLAELDPAEEEAAVMLGANRRTVFFRILLPPILPAIAAGAVQTFARSVAEFGSIVVVSGNIAHRTLTAPVYVLGEIEGGNPAGAAAVSVILLGFAVVLHPLARVLALSAGARRR